MPIRLDKWRILGIDIDIDIRIAAMVHHEEAPDGPEWEPGWGQKYGKLAGGAEQEHDTVAPFLILPQYQIYG